MKVKQNLDIVLENDSDAHETYVAAQSVMAGTIPWAAPCVKLWITKSGCDETKRLLFATTVMVQRMLMATTNYWRDKCTNEGWYRNLPEPKSRK